MFFEGTSKAFKRRRSLAAKSMPPLKLLSARLSRESGGVSGSAGGGAAVGSSLPAGSVPPSSAAGSSPPAGSAPPSSASESLRNSASSSAASEAAGDSQSSSSPNRYPKASCPSRKAGCAGYSSKIVLNCQNSVKRSASFLLFVCLLFLFSNVWFAFYVILFVVCLFVVFVVYVCFVF